jgi:hypothetical protein
VLRKKQLFGGGGCRRKTGSVCGFGVRNGGTGRRKGRGGEREGSCCMDGQKVFIGEFSPKPGLLAFQMKVLFRLASSTFFYLLVY